ncbi:MAG: hypothetical protein OQK24_12740 [Magnetovibrio sp.]|nr:hypothetical protein [Magnetovibrio sp.]
MFKVGIDDLNQNEVGVGFTHLNGNDLDELRVSAGDWRRSTWMLKRAGTITSWHIVKLSKHEESVFVLLGVDADTKEAICISDVDMLANDCHAIRTVAGDIYTLFRKGLGRPTTDQILKLVWMLRAQGFETTLRNLVLVQ